MEVISRRVGEAIIIDGEIEVWVVSIRNGKVRLGFEAPKEEPSHREEVYQAILRAKRARDSNESPPPSQKAGKKPRSK